MYISCPSCSSHNIKKNGHTYYGKQNHQCKKCFRQFVLNNTHTKSEELKGLIKQALKERLFLRAICRIFGVSLNWLYSFAQSHLKQTPKKVGIPSQIVERIKRVQLFGVQMDELWSFVQNKRKKRWIWVAYDPQYRLVIAHHIGDRNQRSAKKLWKKIPKSLHSCSFETVLPSSFGNLILKD